MKRFLSHTIRFFCFLLVFHAFTFDVQGQEDGDDVAVDKANIEIEQPPFFEINFDHVQDQQAIEFTQKYREHRITTHHRSKRFRLLSHITLDIHNPYNDEPAKQQVYFLPLDHAAGHLPAYRYLYYKEINPPPPKAC